MEIQSLQKGFFENDSSSNSANDRNAFIRKTYALLHLEFIFVGGISIITLPLIFEDRYWVFGILMLICQLCHFYFEFSQTDFQDQLKKIMNYVVISVYLISLTFTYIFFWSLLIVTLGGDVLFAYLQLGFVILLLNVYTTINETFFDSSISWIIALMTPIGIQFIANFFYYSQEDYYYYGFSYQTYITMMITWYSCFMLYISQNIIIKRDFSFDEIQIACCKLLGIQYQIIVLLIKSINRVNYNQTILIMADQNEKLKYFKQVFMTFSSFIMILMLYYLYGNGFYSLCSYHYFIDNDINYYHLITTPTVFFWISSVLSLVLFVVIMVLHKKINFILKWALIIVQITFNDFVLVGLSFIIEYDYAIVQTYYMKYADDFQLPQDYLMEIGFCMLSGIGIGLLSYSQIVKDIIDYKKAFFFGTLCPILIFICQIYYTVQLFGSVYLLYMFAILVVVITYLFLILFEFDLQMNKDKIDFDTQEYYLGALLIFQPVKTILTRFVSVFLS